MYKKEIEQTVELLSNNEIQLKKGMSNDDFKKAEELYNVKFPDEYRALLSTVLPYDAVPDEDGFIYTFTDWTNTSKEYVESVKRWINDSTIAGVIYTVTHLDGWRKSWGEKPVNKEEQIELAKRECLRSPIFLPIVNHRFIGLLETSEDSPVYSIHDGSDVVPYGENIWTFFANEFRDGDEWVPVSLKHLAEPMSMYNTFLIAVDDSSFVPATEQQKEDFDKIEK